MKRVLSGLIVMLLLIGVWTLAFNIQPAKATGTIYIRANGSVDSPTAPISTTDNVTYTLMGNINDMIVVQKDNIVIAGRSYSVSARAFGCGVSAGHPRVTAATSFHCLRRCFMSVFVA